MYQCSKFTLIWNDTTCFGLSFRPSSGFQDCTYSNNHLSNRYCCLLVSKQTAVSVWQMIVTVCTVLKSWWWTERQSETCWVSFQNKINLIHWCILGTRWRRLLRHCTSSRKVAGSIPDGVIRIFHWHSTSSRTMTLGLTQPLTKMSTSNISWS